MIELNRIKSLLPKTIEDTEFEKHISEIDWLGRQHKFLLIKGASDNIVETYGYVRNESYLNCIDGIDFTAENPEEYVDILLKKLGIKAYWCGQINNKQIKPFYKDDPAWEITSTKKVIHEFTIVENGEPYCKSIIVKVD
jgi:hypothetical protein